MSFKRVIDIKNLEKTFINNDFLCELKKMIEKGEALLAFRNNEATVYYKGKNLCTIKRLKSYNDYEIDIYSKYLPLSRSKSLIKTNPKRYTESEWQNEFNIKQSFIDVIPEIKDNIQKEALSEALQVSSLYKFSPLAMPDSEIVLLDIEAEFEGIKIREGTKTLTDRIDVVLYHTIEKRLIFLEVKRLSDERLEDKTENYDKILNQLQEYSEVLKDKKYIDSFNREYSEVIKYYNKLNPGFGLSQIEKEPLLGLLIVEFNNPGRKRVSNIKKEIENNGYPVCSIGSTKHVDNNVLKYWYDRIMNFSKIKE